MKENTGWKKDNCDIHKFPVRSIRIVLSVFCGHSFLFFVIFVNLKRKSR